MDLHLLCGLDGVRAVVDTLWTWSSPYAAPLRSNLAAYEAEGDLALLELALDRYYTGWAAARLSGSGPNTALARRILGLQTDSINLLTTFRLLKSDIGDLDPQRFFLPGGEHVSEELFLRLAALSDVDEVLDALKRTPFGPQLDEVIVRYVEENTLSVFERALEDYVMRRALAAGRGDPLGVGIVISYLWAQAERGHEPADHRQGQVRRHAHRTDAKGTDPCIGSSYSPTPSTLTASGWRAADVVVAERPRGGAPRARRRSSTTRRAASSPSTRP